MNEVIAFNTQLHDDTIKMDVCKIMSQISNSYSEDRVNWSEIMRAFFSTRLPKDVYVGIINFMETFHVDATADEIKNNLVMINIV